MSLKRIQAQQAENLRLRQQLETAREALVAARHMIYYEDAPLGWNITRLDEALAAIGEAQPTSAEVKLVAQIPESLHPDTADLVSRFASAMAEKLLKAERKYGYSNGWKSADWMDECRAKLLEHLEKGDPRDVANYCAFLWHHGEKTAAPTPAQQPRQEQAIVMNDHKDTFVELAWRVFKNEIHPMGMANFIVGMFPDRLYTAPAPTPAQQRQESEVVAEALEEVAREAQRNGNDILAMQLFGKAAQKREAGK